MYLETILILSKEKAEVHSVDVGEHMGFSKPSVSRAIGILKNAGYVVMEKDGSLYLTDSGRAIAAQRVERSIPLYRRGRRDRHSGRLQDRARDQR